MVTKSDLLEQVYDSLIFKSLHWLREKSKRPMGAYRAGDIFNGIAIALEGSQSMSRLEPVLRIEVLHSFIALAETMISSPVTKSLGSKSRETGYRDISTEALNKTKKAFDEYYDLAHKLGIAKDEGAALYLEMAKVSLKAISGCHEKALLTQKEKKGNEELAFHWLRPISALLDPKTPRSRYIRAIEKDLIALGLPIYRSAKSLIDVLDATDKRKPVTYDFKLTAVTH